MINLHYIEFLGIKIDTDTSAKSIIYRDYVLEIDLFENQTNPYYDVIEDQYSKQFAPFGYAGRDYTFSITGKDEYNTYYTNGFIASYDMNPEIPLTIKKFKIISRNFEHHAC